MDSLLSHAGVTASNTMDTLYPALDHLLSDLLTAESTADPTVSWGDVSMILRQRLGDVRLGAVQLRQVREAGDNCSSATSRLHSLLLGEKVGETSASRRCYPPFATEDMSFSKEAPYSPPGLGPAAAARPWLQYRTAAELGPTDDSEEEGVLATYPGGGVRVEHRQRAPPG